MIKTTLGSMFHGIQVHGRKPPTSKNGEVGNRVKRAGAIAGVATALALGLTLAPIQAQTASAFDLKSCTGPAAVFDVDQFRINTGSVDFGGNSYSSVLGGPTDDAVVCWQNGGETVQLVGAMYTNSFAKSNTFKGCVRIVLRFTDTGGKNIAAAGTNHDLCDADGKHPAKLSFNKTLHSATYGGVKFGQVHVYAYQKPSAGSTQWQLVSEKHLRYGDPD